ncbi:MAG: HAD-IC family P-type ATPase, partial [Myxococcaceae bacterium]|nr:HAD-IC family P-type ATPase [Myxococcaceae bacterium]
LGRPRVVEVAVEGWSRREVLALLAGAEAGSAHPMSRAIVDSAREEGVAPVAFERFETIPGEGVMASRHCGGGEEDKGVREIALGNEKRMRAIGVDEQALTTWREKAEQMAREGRTPLFVAMDGALTGVVAVADTLAPGSGQAVRELRRMGVEARMLTGDNRVTARALAREVGIDEVIAEVLPVEKAAAIRALEAGGRRVAMVGDGINDAPALAAASVGIALASGMEIAVESAQIVLVHRDARGVAEAIELSRATLRTIRQNLFFAFVYNALAIPVAMGALTFFGGPLLNPMIAAGCMSLSSVSVVLNALRLGRARLAR